MKTGFEKHKSHIQHERELQTHFLMISKEQNKIVIHNTLYFSNNFSFNINFLKATTYILYPSYMLDTIVKNYKQICVKNNVGTVIQHETLTYLFNRGFVLMGGEISNSFNPSSGIATGNEKTLLIFETLGTLNLGLNEIGCLLIFTIDKAGSFLILTLLILVSVFFILTNYK